MDRRAQAILRLDGGAGLAVGITVLALHAWVAELLGFPVPLVLFIGAANVAYGAYSGTLAVRAALSHTPSRTAVDVLIAGNALWACACVAIIATTSGSASAFGMAQVALEGLFVAALALAERRWVRPFARQAGA